MPARKHLPELRHVVGQNIRVYRAAKGLSQEALAERCGIKRTYVDAIERAEVDLRVGTLAKIAQGLEIEPFRLLVAAEKQLSAMPADRSVR
ncbi:helix-turn-helix domain-containing protein [Dokdonella fugitiva]|uniref:helix-turn-helix domain-containing protein n=1 Tax=Dokdonella fugitiva TaxID=328517 RepID=UPI0015FB2A71|nr:helix-turn-helix transcriptional regulator [Dokdonella fugitiva]MBA8884920.1 transcriptional regulator with XRE-family HTH domain [Dokdonella fugitiva]